MDLDVYNPDLPNLGNSNLGNPFDPNYDCHKYESQDLEVEWLWMNDAKYDLRLVYVRCNDLTNRFENLIPWGHCKNYDE